MSESPVTYRSAGGVAWISLDRPAVLNALDTELAAADGAWLMSSVRGVAELRAIDGAAQPSSAHTEKLRAYLGFTNLGY